VSWAVHAHGVVFLAWCAFLPLQATLARRAFGLHRVLGIGSLLLAAAMAFTGFLVVGVKVQAALSGEGAPFWKAFGVPIAADLALFLGFYGAALANRHRPDWHKRLMIAAAATVISAGVWRLWVGATGFNDWAMPAALATTKVFVVAGVTGASRRRGSASPSPSRSRRAAFWSPARRWKPRSRGPSPVSRMCSGGCTRTHVSRARSAGPNSRHSQDTSRPRGPASRDWRPRSA